MKEVELKQLRQRKADHVKPKAPTKSSEEIAMDMERFLSKGGSIQKIPMGVMTDIETGVPLNLSLDYSRGRKAGAASRRFNRGSDE